ncbi:AraC family transcriptional regulator, partial [Enterococcus faecium]
CYAGLDASEVTLKTALPWLSFIRYAEPTDMKKGMLEPAVCIVLQGRKRVLIGQEVTDYGAGSYVLAAIDMLIAGQVTHATDDEPYLG